MPYPSKIVDRAEIRRWISEGKTYRWMVDTYRSKYHLDVSRTMFSNFRRDQDLPPRQSPSLPQVIPWDVREEHRSRGWDLHLHTASRLLDGLTVKPADRSAFSSWWKSMQRRNLVVDYDPETGYVGVPRRDGIDAGYIREPDHRD